MIDAAGYVTYMEMQQLAQMQYPNLPFHEAYVNLLHDAFVKLPKEVVKNIKPILPGVAQQCPEIVEALGTLYGSPKTAFLARIVGILRNTTEGTSSSTTDNATANTSDTLDLATVPNAHILGEVLSALSNAAGANSHSATTIEANAELVHKSMERIADAADSVARQVEGIHVIRKSLVDHNDYYKRWKQTVSAIQIAQTHQAIKRLTEIRDQLGESNAITVSGSGGHNGFAQFVYDFVVERIDIIDQSEGGKHRFFVYNPDTNWYPAFHRLISANPLPPTFCAKSDELDTLCRYMQAVRAQCDPDIIFHLLIPSWYRISIKKPLHFPDSLQPFQVEGHKHKGNPMVQFNLPAAPDGLLHGVANVLDPESKNAIARGVAVATTLPTVGWGINGLCLGLGIGVGALTGVGLLAVPVWVCTACPAMIKAAPAIEGKVYNALCEDAPIVLGSH